LQRATNVENCVCCRSRGLTTEYRAKFLVCVSYLQPKIVRSLQYVFKWKVAHPPSLNVALIIIRCHEISDPLGLSKTQTPEKLRSSGCIENSNPVMLFKISRFHGVLYYLSTTEETEKFRALSMYAKWNEFCRKVLRDTCHGIVTGFVHISDIYHECHATVSVNSWNEKLNANSFKCL